MSTTTPKHKERHPYRTALEDGDPDALAAALHPDVVLEWPCFEAAVRGRYDVLTFLAALAGTIEGLEFIDEFWGNCTHVLIFQIGIDGGEIQGADYIHLDAVGLVKRITITARPHRLVRAVTEQLANMHTTVPAPGHHVQPR
jgi:hypothetical protein